jgi:hypothetical protein
MILAHWHNLLRQTQIPTDVAEDIEFVASTFNYNASGGSTTLSGIQSGDFVLAIQGGDAGVQSATPTGWTNVQNYDAGGVDYRMAYAFSTGTSITYTVTSSADEGFVLAAFRGVDSTTPLDVTPNALSADDSSLTSITPPTITPTSDKCMIVLGLVIDDFDKTDATISTGFTTASFGHQTNINVGVFYKIQTTAQQESPSAISWTGGEAACCGTIALRPA